MKILNYILSLSLFLGFFFSAQAHNDGGGKTQADFPFVYNKGQWPEQVKYRAEIDGAYLYLERNKLHYQFVHIPNHHPGNVPDKSDDKVKGHIFNANFIGSNPNPEISQEGTSSFYFNYFLGNDKSKWASEVRSFKKVKYSNLYKGIDLVLYSHHNTLKYDYHIAPGSDVSQIKVEYDGVKEPKIKNGELIINHSLGKLIEAKPYAYQIINGEEIEIPCSYKMNKSGEISFHFENGYDESKELVIDPELIFSTYSGSSANNFGMTATYDREGAAYTAGTVFSNGYIATTGAFQSSFNDGDVDIGISKFSSDGVNLLYSTYLGGDENETAHSLVVNDSLELFLLGATSSSNFPVSTNAFDRSKENSNTETNTDIYDFLNGSDIIVTKFNSRGTSLIGSTYYGGNGNDGINTNLPTPIEDSYDGLVYNYGDVFRGEIILDSLGNCYIASSTWSTNLNSLNSNSGEQDGLIVKFDPNLENVIWSRYLGGSQRDAIYSIKITDNNNILVGGGTNSFSDFPTSQNVYQTNSSGGLSDGFISLISNDGTSLIKSTYIGTSNYDQVYFVEFDRFGGIYALGQSRGGMFPILNTKVADTSSSQFIIKLQTDLSAIEYSTTFGDGNGNGDINISPTAFLVDRCQNVYVSGWGGRLPSVPDEGQKRLTRSMPITSDAYSSTTDLNDFYLYVISRDADSLLYASYFGGEFSDDHVDGGTSRFDKQGFIYQSVCASCGSSSLQQSDFPTKPSNVFAPNKPIPVNQYGCNNAVFKYDFDILPRAQIGINKQEGCTPYLSTIRDSSERANEVIWVLEGNQFSFENDTTILFDTPGTYTLMQIARDVICDYADTAYKTIDVYPNPININLLDDTITCTQDSIDLTAFHNNTGTEFYWSSNNQFTDTLNSPLDSSIRVEPKSNLQRYFLMVTDTAANTCEYRDSVSVVFIPFQVDASIIEDTACVGNSFSLLSTSTNVDQFTWDFGDGRTNSNDENPTISYPSAGDYTVKIVAQNNSCQVEDSAFVDLNVQPNNLILSSLPDSIYCGTDTVEFSQNSQGTAERFLWSSQPSFGDTLNNYPNDSSIKIYSPVSDTFYYKISDKYCTLDDKLYVEYYDFELNIVSPVPDSGCAPFDYQLNTSLSGITSFEILYGDGNGTTVDQNPFINYSNEGIYKIEVIGNNSQCNLSDTIVDSIKVLPKVNILPISDTLICFGDTINISASSFGTANTFRWDTLQGFPAPINPTGDSTISVFPDKDQVYYILGESGICSDSDAVEIRVEEVEVAVDEILSICIDDTISIPATLINAINPINYQWSPISNIISGANTNLITVAPKQDTVFFLESTSSIGCKDFDTTEVEVEVPTFDDALITASNDSIFRGESINLQTNRNGSNLVYYWEPVDLMDNPNSPQPNASPTQDTTLKVTIIDMNTGCEVEAFKRIQVYEINCGEPDIFIPSAFTPNGDGNNDVFYVRGANLDNIELNLYNRWGELVFETTDKNLGWDGVYKGKEADPGVFVYHLRATCLDGQDFFKKGNVTLIR